MFKRVAAAVVSITLGVALSLVGATGAQALIVNDDGGGGGGGAPTTPVHSASIDCSTASVSLTGYDVAATATVVVDGVTEHSGTFGGSYTSTWSLTSDATHTSHQLQVTVVAADSQYDVAYDHTVSECYTAPPVVDSLPLTYETVVWSMPSPNNGTSATYPQVGVSQYKGETAQTLDVAVPSTCGTQYQVDVYLQTNGAIDNTAAIDAMFAKGLAGPNGAQDGKFLAGQSGNPGVSGLNHAWKFVKNADCPSYPVCTGNTTLPTSTNVAPQGWNLTHDSKYVPGGIELTSVGTTHGGVIDKAVSFPLSEAGAFARSMDISSGGGASFAIEFDTAAGTVTWEPLYTDTLWTDSAGILPRNNPNPGNNNGQGGPYSGSLTDLLSNPTVTHVWIGIWNTTETAVLHSVTFNCQTQPFDYVAPAPVACVVNTSIPWAAEAGDLTPTVGPEGLQFTGPHTAAMDYYQRVTAGNMQGLTGMTVTYAPGGSGYQALVVVEVDPNVDLDATPGINHYATISSVLGAGDTSGTFDVQNGLWYTNKIAYSSPGGQGHPISWAAMTALMPDNTLLSAPSLHQQTQTGADATSVVTSLSSSCGSTNFVPLIDVAAAGDPTNTDQLCTDAGLQGGVITVVITPHINYEITDSGNAVVPFDATTGKTAPLAPGNYTVAVTADSGYHLTSASSYSLSIAAYDGKCVQLVTHPLVDPLAAQTQISCKAGGSYTLSNDQLAADAVVWTVNGSPVSQGTYSVTTAGHYVIDAAPGTGFGFADGTQTQWVFDFSAPTCDLKTLALTGSDPSGALVLAGFLTLFGLSLVRRAAHQRKAARS